MFAAISMQLAHVFVHETPTQMQLVQLHRNCYTANIYNEWEKGNGADKKFFDDRSENA